MRPLRVGATPVPHAEILDRVRPILATHGIDLRVEIFEDFDGPNEQLASGRLHANFFQYLPFLADFNRRTGNALVAVAPVHVEPFGLYSTTVASLADLPDYAEVALPCDAVNVHRSLMMLTELGLIECAPNQSTPATVADVRANPRGLVFKEMAGWLLADVRADFDAVFLFGNQAIEWGVDIGGALHCDRVDTTYAEYLVTRPDLATDAAIRCLAAALNGDEIRDFIVTAYDGQVIPAF